MRAADRLAEYRKLAAKQRASGAEKGRKNRKLPAGAKLATSQNTKKRSPRALEKVAKEESVPRAELALTEKVLSAAPDLRPRIESEELSLEQAADLAGVPRKQPRASRPKKEKPSQARQNLDIVTEHGGDIYELTAPGVSVFAHPKLDVSIMVYGPGSIQYIGVTDDNEHEQAGWNTPTAEQAIALLKEKLGQVS
ncbi:hypothetical protein [Neorhodopirellula lusitana]|uniref:hypothetical protein n=1 Tax=Neorhodopirellula lusitana TaxID=445327 RepID=UPI003850C712